jgi:hypothetical protein
MATDPDTRVIGVDHDELKRRALLKLQLDPALKFSLTIAIDRVEEACRDYSDSRIRDMLEPGMNVLGLDGKYLEVERDADKLRVRSALTGKGLDVSDGAFVIFIDSRCSGSEALEKWGKLVKEDTRVMVIPLKVPKGQSVESIVSAKRQGDAEGFAV